MRIISLILVKISFLGFYNILEDEVYLIVEREAYLSELILNEPAVPVPKLEVEESSLATGSLTFLYICGAYL